MAPMLRISSVCCALLALSGCANEAGRARAHERPPAPARESALSSMVLPQAGPLFPENQVRLAPGDPRDTERLANVEVCAECHADVVEAWRSSPHARASFDNPWYRQSIESIREERSNESSRFCAGCHDPVLLLSGAMEEEVQPNDPRAHAGITCMLCHGIQEVRPDGVASYTLSTREVFLPDPADEEEVREHVRQLTPAPLRTAQMCGTCHRSFLGPAMGNMNHLTGIDDLSAWQRSGYAGSGATRLDQGVEPATCQGCHMPLRPATRGDFAADEGTIHSHRFAGAHTSMAHATGDREQLHAAREILQSAARIDVAAIRTRDRLRSWLPADHAAVRGGQRIEIDVVVHNQGTGHRFPGGTLDAQDTWIEVELRDARGRLFAEAGAEHGAGAEDDATAHRMHALLVDPEAQPSFQHRVHRFSAKIYDHTLGPRDAEVARYSVAIPRDAVMPVSVRARLRHRRHNAELHRGACESQSTPTGRAFFEASEHFGNRPIDACTTQPITELSEALVWIGEGSEHRGSRGGARAPEWRRLFDHALALIGNVQEYLDDARPSIDRAIIAAPDQHTRAMLFVQRARLEGRQGRLEEALADLRAAEALAGPRPAIHRMRGDAYAQVWRWTEAADAYRAAAEAAQLDDTRWVDLSRARGSAGDDRLSLEAAIRGLALQPRDEALLRSQYLALDALGRPADAARDAFVSHRVPDELPELRLRCGQERAWCAAERLPVTVYRLRVVR
jgi:hypothetical protein